MKIEKAVITAAAANQRVLPLQTVIDRDGTEKSVLTVLIEEVLSAGIEDICVVVWPGDEARYESAAGQHARRLNFVAQNEARGYGHAIYCAREFTGPDPFLHLVGDHLYVSNGDSTCARNIVELARTESCAVSAVQVTRESHLSRFGAVGGRRIPSRQGLYRVETVVEKPTPTEAEQKLMIPGVRAGYYLCFYGMHVLTPTVMTILGQTLASEGRASLSAALKDLSSREQYLAAEQTDRRFDIGDRYGLLLAQFALALNGRDRDEILTNIVDLLAARDIASASGVRQ